MTAQAAILGTHGWFSTPQDESSALFVLAEPAENPRCIVVAPANPFKRPGHRSVVSIIFSGPTLSESGCQGRQLEAN